MTLTRENADQVGNLLDSITDATLLLRDIERDRDAVSVQRHTVIERALAAGATQTQVSVAMGITRQAFSRYLQRRENRVYT